MIKKMMATAAVAGVYLDPIPETPAHEELLSIMGRSSLSVAAVAVRVGGRTAMVVVADDLEDPLAGVQFMEELARAIGEALSRLLSAHG